MNAKNVLRWVVLIPAIGLAVLLSTVFLHLVLYNSLIHFVNPYPELPERLLTPFVVSFMAIYSTYIVAPRFKVQAVLVIGVLLFICLYTFLVIVWSDGYFFGNKLYIKNSGWQAFFSLLGIFIGVIRTVINHIRNSPDTDAEAKSE